MNSAEFANISEAERDFWWFRGMREILFSILDPLVKNRRVRSVLEAGCGTGYNAVALHHRYGWKTYPIDLQMEGLRHAGALGLTQITQGDVASLPFREAAFDAVVCLDVIVHFPVNEESRALAELVRVLTPGGLLILRVSAFDILRSRHSEFTFERQRFTSTRLVAGVVDRGIRVLRCTYANTLLFPVALAKFRIWEPLTASAAHSGVRPVSGWLNRLLSSALSAESRWLQSGHDMPFGQSLILIGEKAA